MYIEDVLSMPDKWEYPFFAIWDSVRPFQPLSLHMIQLTTEHRLSTAFHSR